MSTLADFLQRVFDDGEAVLSGPVSRDADAAARSVLASAFAHHALDVAGPPIAFDPPAAVAAARLLAAACWQLVAPDDDAPALPPPGEPEGSPLAGRPAAHLSADVTLRFLPVVHRRARLRACDDPLAAAVADLLRRWPLSGVLADLPGSPAGDPDFGGHPGLQLLYAERLLAHEKPLWLPKSAPARERVELVYRGRGRPVPRPVTVESPDE
jgi:hypothetical protein